VAQLIGVAGIALLHVYLERPPIEGIKKQERGRPRIPLTFQSQIDQLSIAYRTLTVGKFIEAKNIFLEILQTIPLVVVQTPSEVKEVKEFISICREYLLGISTELARKDIIQNNGEHNLRVLELAAYFTHCDLQEKHLLLSLKSAMNIHTKMNYYGYASEFARRILDLNPPSDIVAHTQKVLSFCEKKRSYKCC